MSLSPSIIQATQTDLNMHFVGNPQVTFFKSVFKRHTNFAIESFNIQSKKKITLSATDSTIIPYKIPKYGDLLGKVFLRLEVPPMKTTNENKFKFNNDFGLSIIENIKLKINGVLIENIDSKILYILYKLYHTDEKQKQLSTLINGSIHNNLTSDNTTTTTNNSTTYTNKFFNSPIRTKKEILYIPLDFAFTHFYKTYIPIFLLLNKAIEIEITLRPLNDMYTIEVFDKDYWYYAKDDYNYQLVDNPVSTIDLRTNALNNTSMSGTSINSINNIFKYGEQTNVSESLIANYPYYLKRYESRKRIKPSITDSINNFTYNNESFSLNPSLQIEQIYLTAEELSIFSAQENKYLIQQIFKKEFVDINGNQKKTLLVENHSNILKELIITIERNDNSTRNQFLNFTNYEYSTLNEDIIRKYQDNWWFDASGNETISGIVNICGIIPNDTKTFTITTDTFQDFLFKYGPYGEAGHLKNDSSINWSSNKISPQYKTYTIEEIDEFRNIWKYRPASDIPIINNSNFSDTWCDSPLNSLDILFDGHSRENNKKGTFFKKIQPYLYHTNTFNSNIYIYSFSIQPEEYQPGGFCNMNLYRKIQYSLDLNKTDNYKYDINIYSIKYNFITFNNNMCIPLYNLAQ